MPYRFTPKVHEELRDRLAICVEDPDWIRDNSPDYVAAATSLHDRLNRVKPGVTIRGLTPLERTVAATYLRDTAASIESYAEFAETVAQRGQRSFAARLRSVARELELEQAS